MLLFYLIIIRFLDIISTYLCMSKYGGWEKIEMVPVSSYLIKTVGYAAFSGINLIIYIALLLSVFRFTKEKFRNRLLWVIAGIQTGVVIMNFLTYIWV